MVFLSAGTARPPPEGLLLSLAPVAPVGPGRSCVGLPLCASRAQQPRPSGITSLAQNKHTADLEGQKEDVKEWDLVNFQRVRAKWAWLWFYSFSFFFFGGLFIPPSVQGGAQHALLGSALKYRDEQSWSAVEEGSRVCRRVLTPASPPRGCWGELQWGGWGPGASTLAAALRVPVLL